MKRFKWEARCEFKNVHMQEHGTTCTVTVTSAKEADARHEAQLEMCRKLGLSTMMHRYVNVKSIRNVGRA